MLPKPSRSRASTSCRTRKREHPCSAQDLSGCAGEAEQWVPICRPGTASCRNRTAKPRRRRPRHTLCSGRIRLTDFVTGIGSLPHEMLLVWDGKDGWQEDEATKCGKQARGDGGGSRALSGRCTEREGEHTQRIEPGDRLSSQACDPLTDQQVTTPGRTSGTRRARIYDQAVQQALIVVWEAADRICGQEAEANHLGAGWLDGTVWTSGDRSSGPGAPAEDECGHHGPTAEVDPRSEQHEAPQIKHSIGAAQQHYGADLF